VSSVDVVVEDLIVSISVENPVISVFTSGPPGPPGPAGGGEGGGMDQATADARYVNVTGDAMSGDLLVVDDNQIRIGNTPGVILYENVAGGQVYASGTIDSGEGLTTEGTISAASSAFQVDAEGRVLSTALDVSELGVINDDHTKFGVQIRRTDPALSTSDPEIFAIYNGPSTTDDERASWANEKGQWRTSNIPAPGEDALKIIGATGATGNMIVATKQDGTIVFRVGPNGTTIAELGLRLVAGSANNLAVGRVLVGDSAGNATWQVVPVATGAAPVSPYTGQLWADPA
jgi:hypothetical protein